MLTGLGSHNRLGQSYFMVEDNLNKIWKHDIRPLLEEYNFEEGKSIEEKYEDFLKRLAPENDLNN